MATALPQPYFQNVNKANTISVNTVSGGSEILNDFNNNNNILQKHKSSSSSRSSPRARTLTVRLHLSARDVPEPDSRSHSNFVVLYYAREIKDNNVQKQSSVVTTTLENEGNEETEQQQQQHQQQQQQQPEPQQDPQPEQQTKQNSDVNGEKKRNRQFGLITRQRSLRRASSTPRRSKPPNIPSTTPPNNKNINCSNNNQRTTTKINPQQHNNIQFSAQRSKSAYGQSRYSNNNNVYGHGRTPSSPDSQLHHYSRSPKSSSLPTTPSNVSSKHSTSPTSPTSDGFNTSILVPLLRLVPQSKSLARSPEHALSRVAPSDPREVVSYSTPCKVKSVPLSSSPPTYTRSGWTRIGVTEIARKHGRDVEFARTFTLSFLSSERIIVRACVFDASGKKRLVGTSDISIRAVYGANGERVSFPLKFASVCKADRRIEKHIPDGTFAVVAQRIEHKPSSPRQVNISDHNNFNEEQQQPKEFKFRLDVECSQILRATTLSTTAVRRVFYTIHGILDKNDDDSDAWTLMFRSESVEMIHTKRDGGSMQYNYFSSAKLRAVPGEIMKGENKNSPLNNNYNIMNTNTDNEAVFENDRNRNSISPNTINNNNNNSNENNIYPTSTTPNSNVYNNKQASKKSKLMGVLEENSDRGGIFSIIGKVLGVTQRRKMFFSLPGADLFLLDPKTRLKLSIWEDNGVSAGYDLIADTLFTMAELKQRRLGESSAIKVHANVVGKAVLKYVECSPDPRYFCLSLRMQSID